jgi:linoleoyl-CoA desaturase
MAKVAFNNKNAVFYQSLKTAVDNYFKGNNLKKTGNWKLYAKALVLIPMALALYVALLTVSFPWPVAVLLCGLLGFALASIGFNVMHDACHGSYSSKKWVNDLLGLTLNALGGNAFIWKQKHNIIHHTYTNIDGIDDDIAKAPVIRQCSTQPWKPIHKIQHIYLPLIYGISSMAWIFVMDMTKYTQRMIYTTKLSKMDTKEHVLFWVSKVLYLVFYIIIPIAIVGWSAWLVGFLCMHLAMGTTLSVVFQLAHVVEETEFETVITDTRIIENEWAIHQLKTTANFAPDNKIISWFVGGLNYQIEHHLFSRVSHIHYPALSKIVVEKCREFDVEYNCIPTMNAAVASHFRFMKMLGQRPA